MSPGLPVNAFGSSTEASFANSTYNAPPLTSRRSKDASVCWRNQRRKCSKNIGAPVRVASCETNRIRAEDLEGLLDLLMNELEFLVGPILSALVRSSRSRQGINVSRRTPC